MDNQDWYSYLEKIFSSISKNAKSLKGNDNDVRELLQRCNSFYMSLFSKDDGVFKSNLVDKNLKTLPPIRPAKTTSTKSKSPGSSTPTKGSPGRGLGKGSPGCQRKETVTKRQQKNRSKRKDSQGGRKRKADETTTDDSQPSTSATPTSTAPPPQKRPATSTTRTDASPVEKPEPQQPLLIQYQSKKEIKTVSLIQDLCKAQKDNAPISTELDLYWELMDSWKTLDQRLVMTLKEMKNDWSETLSDWTTDTFIKQMIAYHGCCNGITNCLHHILGCMVKHAVKQDERENDHTSMQSTYEKLEERIMQHQYTNYVKVLTKCSCELCTSVVVFDEDYERYYEILEEEGTVPGAAPKFKDRPMHCSRSEIHAQYLRNSFKGLSAATLNKYYYFANATNPFSPPVISLGSPTQVYEAVNRYMKPFLQQRKLDDPLPSSWIIPVNTRKNVTLEKVPHENFHLYDGDSCEITIDDNTATPIKSVRTGNNKVAIRLPNQDAPETSHSVRIYKQNGNVPTISQHTFATRHIGIESLRAARQMVFEARSIYVEVERDRSLAPSVPMDVHGRRLMDVWLGYDNGSADNETKVRLSCKLASEGYTMSFYTTGIDSQIDEAMRNGKRQKRGMFNLPEELFCYPFRPWELRQGINENPETYKEFRPILNVPADPATAWKPGQRAPPVEDGDDWPESEENDLFFFRMVECPLRIESICFPAKSTIPNAGYGLFLKPHKRIERGTHLCLYSDQPLTEEELQQSRSSNMYMIETSKGTYDAEHPTGNNLGRYANQPNVITALRRIKEMSTQPLPSMDENDWKQIEALIDSACNGEYKVVGKQLVVVAKVDLEKSNNSEEIFTNYGSIRTYWIAAEREKPGCFGGEITDIVNFLLKSSDSNWTEEQRLGCARK